jgi:PPE-repeat protein
MVKSIIAELIRVLVIKKMVAGITGAFGLSSEPGGGEGGTTAGARRASVGSFGIAGALASPIGILSSSSTAPTTSSPLVTVNNYGNDDVFVDQKGDDLTITIQKIASDISRGKGPIPSAIENRYRLTKG